MIQSMTGFATKTVALTTPTNESVNVNIVLKSLNTRFFEVSCRLPQAFAVYETELIKALKKRLKRGQIYLTMHLSDPHCFKTEVVGSKATLEGYLNAINSLKKDYSVSGEVTVETLFKIPHLFVTQDGQIPEQTKELLFEGVDEIINLLIANRLTEGEQIKADIQARIDHMHEEVELLEKEYSKVFAEKQQEINEKLDKIKASSEELAEHQRALLYHALDKMDLHEEITRFKGHLEQIKAILQSDKPEKGKQFDFTLQELAREANTIASKCSNASISNHAIALKVEIEKCREQIQNVV